MEACVHARVDTQFRHSAGVARECSLLRGYKYLYYSVMCSYSCLMYVRIKVDADNLKRPFRGAHSEQSVILAERHYATV